ncbi:MAG: hypothetical protein ABII18_04525, partial [bacterium]
MTKRADFIASFLNHFKSNQTFTAKDVVEFFHAHDETLPETTIHWRIYHLKKQGVIESLGRGLYKIAN